MARYFLYDLYCWQWTYLILEGTKGLIISNICALNKCIGNWPRSAFTLQNRIKYNQYTWLSILTEKDWTVSVKEHLPSRCSEGQGEKPSLVLSPGGVICEVLPVPAKQKCIALFSSVVPPSCAKMTSVLTLLDSSGVCDQSWRQEVKCRDRSIIVPSSENYKAFLACVINYIFILLAWDRWIFLHTKVPS